MATLAASSLVSAAALATGMTAPSARGFDAIKPIAEFEEVSAVAISDDYMQGGYDGIGLARAILAAGVELLVLSTNADSPTIANLSASGIPKASLANTKALALAHNNLWLRDFGPLFVRDHMGIQAVDFVWGGPGQESEDFSHKLAAARSLPLRTLPIMMDGGNVLSDGKICVSGHPLTPTDTQDSQLFDQLGCERGVVIANPPHAHVDMWLKFVAPGKALVPELDAQARQALQRYYGGTIPSDQLQFAERLDAAARQLSAFVQVERIPSPVLYRGTYRTYTNAILLNHQAIVPRYRRYGWGYDSYPDAAELKNYEQTVETRFKQHGYSVTFVDADGIIYNGGAFHCVTLQIPK